MYAVDVKKIHVEHVHIGFDVTLSGGASSGEVFHVAREQTFSCFERDSGSVLKLYGEQHGRKVVIGTRNIKETVDQVDRLVRVGRQGGK